MKKICKWCGDKFENRASEFCSTKCTCLDLDYRLTV